MDFTFQKNNQTEKMLPRTKTDYLEQEDQNQQTPMPMSKSFEIKNSLIQYQFPYHFRHQLQTFKKIFTQQVLPKLKYVTFYTLWTTVSEIDCQLFFYVQLSKKISLKQIDLYINSFLPKITETSLSEQQLKQLGFQPDLSITYGQLKKTITKESNLETLKSLATDPKQFIMNNTNYNFKEISKAMQTYHLLKKYGILDHLNPTVTTHIEEDLTKLKF